jgi:hypothetical protein
MFRSGDPTSSTPQIPETQESKDISIKLYPDWYKHIFVEWAVPADWGPCTFNVFCSPNFGGPYERLNNAPLHGNHLKDTDTHEFSKTNKAFYIVEAILEDSNNAKLRSKPTTWTTTRTPWVQLRANEIQRRELILLKKFTGNKASLFRRKTYGERCPDCWNANVQKAMKDHCKTCYGTTFKGGYFECYNTYVQYDPAPDVSMKTYFGKFEPNQMACWTISVPEFYPDDIVVRHGRWEVHKVEQTARTELQGITVRQLLQLTELDKGMIEYELIKRVPEFPLDYT